MPQSNKGGTPKNRALSVPSDAPATTDSLVDISTVGGELNKSTGVPKGTGPKGGVSPNTDSGYTLSGNVDTDFDNIAEHYRPADLDQNTWRGIWRTVMLQESGGDLNTQESQSPNQKLPAGKRAYGVMQVTPDTGRGLGFTDEELKDPYYNFMAGVKNLRTEYDELGKDKRISSPQHRISLTFAAYHAGRKNVLASLNRGEDGVPDVDDGSVNTRDYTFKKTEALKQYLAQAQGAAGESGEPALLTDEEAAEKFPLTADEGMNFDLSAKSETDIKPQDNTQIGKGVLDDPQMKALMEMNPAQRGLAIIEKMGVDPAMAALDEAIRGKLGVVTPASHPHKINRTIPVTFEVRQDEKGRPMLTPDEVRDAVTIALTGDTSLPSMFRQATGENPGEFLDNDEANKWLMSQIQSGTLRLNQVGDKWIAEGQVPVQNWVVNRINALAQGGVQGYLAETSRMRQEIGDNERLVAEEEYAKAINEAKRAKNEERVAELEAELEAKYPTTRTEELSRAIRSGTARGLSELLRTGMNIEQIVEAPVVDALTDDQGKQQYLVSKAKEAKQARMLKASIEAKTPSARRWWARMAEAAVKEVVYSPVYIAGGAVMGPAGLIYTTAIRDADKPMNQFLESVAASIIELPFGTGFRSLIAGKDVGASIAKSGAMASGGLGEFTGDALVDVAKGELPNWEEALGNLVIGAAFELGQGAEQGTKEGGYQMKGVGEGGAVPTELRSFIGVTQGEDGQIRFQGVIKRGENVGLIELDPQHPMVLKYAIQAQEGKVPFVSMKPEDFDQALTDFKGTGKVQLPKMSAAQVEAYLRGEGSVRVEKGKLTTTGEKKNEEKEEQPIVSVGADESVQTGVGLAGETEQTQVQEKGGGKVTNVLSTPEQKQAEREASLSESEYAQLESAYDKLGTTEEKEIRNLFRQADRRFVKKIQNTPEGEFAQSAFDTISKLTTEEQQALAKIIPEGFAAPSKTPTTPGETSDYSASIQGMTDAEFESNPQLVANEREVGQFLEDAQSGKVTTATTADEERESATASAEYKKDQESITQGEKKIKVGRATVTLPKDIAAKWEQADLDYEAASAKVQNSKLPADEKSKRIRVLGDERKKERNKLIDEYRRREAEQIGRGYLRDSDRPVAILDETEDTYTILVTGEDNPREVPRSAVETRKERGLKKTKKAKLPTGIKIGLGLGDFSETKQGSRVAEGVVYINDNARSAIEDALEVEVDRGFTIKGDRIPEVAKKLREKGLKRIAKQLENASEGRAGAAIIPVTNEDAGEVRFHEQIHTVAYDKRLSIEAVRRLYRDNTAVRNLLEELRTSKDKTIREEFSDMNPYDFIQEVIAYGATGDHASLGVSPDLLYDALVEVMSEYNNAFPNEQLEVIADNALINFDAIMKEASRRDINEQPKAARKKQTGKSTGADKKGRQSRSEEISQREREILRAEETRADRIVNAVRELRKGEGPVSIDELRDEFPELRLEKFHQVLKELVDAGRVFVLRVDNANQLKEKDKAKLLRIGDDYFNSVTIRTNPVSDTLILRARGKRPDVNTREENFKKWFEGSEVVDYNDEPLMVFHGTTHDFEVFDIERAEWGSFIGRGFYFTTNARDAASNYSIEGADLSNRITAEMEKLENQQEEQLRLLNNQLEEAQTDEEREKIEAQIEEAENQDFKAQAKAKLVGKAEVVLIPAYLSMKNGFDIREFAEDDKVLRSEAEMVEDPFAEDPEDTQPGEAKGTLIDFMDNLYNEVLTASDDYQLAEKVKSHFIQNLEDATGESIDFEMSATHKQVFDAMKKAIADSYLLDYVRGEEGQMLDEEIMRLTLIESGFDGLRMNAVEAFKNTSLMKNLEIDDYSMETEHFIVWTPEQIKSPYNNGDFNPEERSFLRKVEKRNEVKTKFEKHPDSVVIETTSPRFRDRLPQTIDKGFEGELPKAITEHDKTESSLITIIRKNAEDVTSKDVKKVITDGRFAVMTGGNAKKTANLQRELNSMGYKSYPAGDGLFVILNSQADIANMLRLGARYKRENVLIGDSGAYRAPFTRNTPLGRIGQENYSKENKPEFDVTDGVRVKLPKGVVSFNVADVFTSKRKQDAAEKRLVSEMTETYKKSFDKRADATTVNLHDYLIDQAINEELTITKTSKKGREKKTRIFLPNKVVASFLEKTTDDLFGEVPDKSKLSDDEYNAIRARRAQRDGLAIVTRALSGRGDRKSETQTGLSWYAAAIKKMHEITGNAFPEVLNQAQLRALFDVTLAISSQGNKVKENYQYAVQLWRRLIEEFELGRDGTDKIFPTKLKDPKVYYDSAKKKERVAENYGRFGAQLEKFNFLTQGYVPVRNKTELTRFQKQGAELKKTEEFEKVHGAQQWYVKDQELVDSIKKYGHIGGVFEYLLTPLDSESHPYRATDILGPKIGAFFLNIAGFSQLVTVDMWASRWFYRINGGLVNESQPKGIQDTPTNDTDGDIIRGAMQAIANEYNKKHQNKITPADVQALLWYAEKDIWFLSGAKDSGTIDFATAADKTLTEAVIADIGGNSELRSRVIEDFQTSSPEGDRVNVAGTDAARKESENFFVRQMALPARIGLSATSRKQIVNRKLLTYDAKEWSRHAEWAKGEPLNTNEVNDLYALLQAGFRATTKQEHDKAIEDLQNFVDEVSSMNIFEFLLNARRAGMLSGIKTAGRNTVSNLAHLVAEELKRGPAAPLDMTLALMSSDKDRTVQGISPLGVWNGIKSLPQGFKAFKDTIFKGNTGATYETFNLGYDPHVTPSWMTGGKTGARILNATVGNFAKYVFRFQAAQDAVFRTYAYNRAMYEVAWLEQKNGGRKIADVLANPTVAQSDMAWRAAEFAVFQNDNFINTGYQRWKGNRSELIKYVLDYELPFIKTGSNIFLQTMDYLVIGSAVKASTALSKDTLKDIGKGDWKKLKQKMWAKIDDPETRAVIAEAFGRGFVGLGLAYIGYRLAAAGLMYGFGDEDEKERQRRIAQGAGAGHMKLGDHWIDIRAISPIGTLMLAGASAYRAQTKELTGENTRTDAMIRLFSTLVSEGLPMARVADEFLNPKQAQSYARRLIGAGSLVPAIVAEAAAVQDKVQRDQKGDGLKDSIKKEVQARLPKTPVNTEFNRQSLPAKTDVFGRELEQPLGIDPFSTKKDTTNKVTQETAAVGWSMTPPKRDTKKGESIKDFQERKTKTQDLIDRVFTELVDSPAYPSSATKLERKELFDDSAALARRAVKTGEKVSDAELDDIVKLVLDKWKARADIEKDSRMDKEQKDTYKKRISSKYSKYIKGATADDDN